MRVHAKYVMTTTVAVVDNHYWTFIDLGLLEAAPMMPHQLNKSIVSLMVYGFEFVSGRIADEWKERYALLKGEDREGQGMSESERVRDRERERERESNASEPRRDSEREMKRDEETSCREYE